MAEDSDIRILERLSPEQRAALEALGEPVTFPPGHSIFLEGQPARSVLIIQQGSLKVTQRALDKDKTEIVLAIRGSGELMGEEGALLGLKRSSTVTAITQVAGLDIAADKWHAFVDEQDLLLLLYRVAVYRRLQSDRRALAEPLDVRTRLAVWFLEMASTELARPVEAGLLIPLTQPDMASKIGVSLPSLTAALSAFRKDGLVSTSRGSTVLHDLEALRRILSSER